MAWTEERIELLKGMWADGLKASVIGKRLRLGQDAVRRKATDIGLEDRRFESKNMFFRSSGVCRGQTCAAVAQLTGSMCKWPEGDPMEEMGFHFCGERKRFMAPYCDRHMAIAYNPAARKAR